MAIKIGLIRGNGTGGVLLDTFEQFLSAIATTQGIEVQFVRDIDERSRKEWIYHSYQSLVDIAGDDAELYKTLSSQDSNRLFQTVQKWHAEGVRTIFRTSINAEALYHFRKRVGAVKELLLTTEWGVNLLFIRDQVEGYYSNDYYNVGQTEISFGGIYTKTHQQTVAKYAVQRGDELWGEGNFDCFALYKHHLFGRVFEDWFHEVSAGIKVQQPDTGIYNLSETIRKELVDGEQVNQVIFCSNEVGDLIFEWILSQVNVDPKRDAYSRNIYTKFNAVKSKKDISFVEYQTIHGSADDLLVGHSIDSLIPNATLRVAATIGEDVLHIEHLRYSTDLAISKVDLMKHWSYENRINTIIEDLLKSYSS